MADTGPVDDWWHALPPERRWSIHRWLTAGAPMPTNTEVKGQQELPFPATKGRRR